MTSSRLKIALAASLAVNLFAISFVVGKAATQVRLHEKAPASSTRGSTNAMMRAANVLPPEKRDLYIARLKAQGESAQADFKAARAARVRASEMIAAPTYDQPRIAALLAEARTHDVRARTRFETAVIEFAATLTPQERKILGERLSPTYRPPRPPAQAGQPASGAPTPPSAAGATR